MTRIIVDSDTQARLDGLNELLEICDESGRTLGYFHPAGRASEDGTEQIKSPLSREELERRRQERTGRPLSDILKNLADA